MELTKLLGNFFEDLAEACRVPKDMYLPKEKEGDEDLIEGAPVPEGIVELFNLENILRFNLQLEKDELAGLRKEYGIGENELPPDDQVIAQNVINSKILKIQKLPILITHTARSMTESLWYEFPEHVGKPIRPCLFCGEWKIAVKKES